MSQIPSTFIEDLMHRVDLATLVGEHVQLKKSGNIYKGRCPFHGEKTPSFYVYNEGQSPHYHCFGCGAHGDAIEFLKNFEHQSFNDAVETISKRLGLEVPRDATAQKAADRLKPLLDMAAFAGEKYRQALHHHPRAAGARNYLQQREVSADMAELYSIGYAPGDRQFITRGLHSEQLQASIELKLTLDKDGRTADLFQNRLMFPIRDTRGRTVAFAGRTLVNDRSKYINSPESPVFHKSHLLYGLWEARKQSRKLDQLIVVEGYLDVISLAQFGITNAVAAMGTATNEENLNNLLTTCANIQFCFDGDRAGLEAANKALSNILPLLADGQRISFLILPEGEDPDSLIRREGASHFKQRIAKAIPLSEFFFISLSRGLNLELPEDKGILSTRCKQVLPLIKARVLKDGLYQRLRDLTWSTTWKNSGKWRKSPQPIINAKPVNVPNRTAARICLGLYQNPAWAKEISDILSYEITQQDETALPIFLQWIIDARIETSDDLLYELAADNRLLHRFGHLFQELQHTFSEEDNSHEARQMLNLLKEKYLRSSFESIETKLLADPKNTELQEKYRAITKELNNSKGQYTQ